MTSDAPILSEAPTPDDPSDGPSPWVSRSRQVSPRRRRWGRALLALGATGVVAGGGLWVAVHRVPWLGPMCADGLRSVIGAEAVTTLEEIAYGAQDRVNRLVKSGDQPQAYWDVPEQAEQAAAPGVDAPAAPGCTASVFRPADVGPVHQSWSAPGDGRWLPIKDPRRLDAPPRMFKTLLHPDRNRSWAAVSIVAVDLQGVELHLMAGTREPVSETTEGQAYQRKAQIPESHQAVLLAAFNGGFKAEHGRYGMGVDGVSLLPPRTRACMVAALPGKDGKASTVVIGDHDAQPDRAAEATWWRQTPECMLTGGALHPGLASDDNTAWGATLDGNTVIRRSAIGVSADGRTLYSGIGDHTTARALALAMQHAGAADVAQLDVNWSYPKLVLYVPRATDGRLVAMPLSEGFEFADDEYIGSPSPRDFFYLTRQPDPPGCE